MDWKEKNASIFILAAILLAVFLLILLVVLSAVLLASLLKRPAPGAGALSSFATAVLTLDSKARN